MNAFSDGKVQRISKVAARKMYESGQEIGLCASKLYPSLTGYGFLCKVNKGRMEELSYYGTDFDSVTLLYTRCNCTHETGTYPSFYIIKDVTA